MQSEIGLLHFWQQGDSVTHSVAYLLLAMSLLSWFFILTRLWSLWRSRRQMPQLLDNFWSAADLGDAANQLQLGDKEAVLSPLAQAAAALSDDAQAISTSLAHQVPLAERVTRVLRGALNDSQHRLEHGQVLLATVGSTAPFVGLFGTVWGIYHALGNIATNGQVAIEKIAGPVGEALIMTAFGLVVAIPAVVAYNLCGKLIRQLSDELEGFAGDLQSHLSQDTKG